MEYKEENQVWQLAVHCSGYRKARGRGEGSVGEGREGQEGEEVSLLRDEGHRHDHDHDDGGDGGEKKMRKSPNEFIFQAYPEDSVTLGDFHYHKVFVSHVQHFSH